MKPKILIVDDEKPLRDTLARWLRPKYDCLTAPDSAEALRLIGENPDLALMISDVRMPGEDGVELVKKAKAANPEMGAILLTAYGTVELAVEAMKEGADDFFQKPITDLEQFELRVEKALRTASLAKEVTNLRSQLNTELENFTGRSPTMERFYQMIRKVAPTDSTVLIEGPSGSGKELTARAIHNLSKRAKGPFVAVECAALSATLMESELFGHEEGSFTDAKKKRIGKFEAAGGGTLFLDEIGEIDLETQKKLLRVLETRVIQRVGGNSDVPVNFRLVAATNKDLADMVAKGTFREDLYYRLNVIDLHTPALKDHREDIAPLTARFIKEFANTGVNPVTGIEPDALRALEDYDWPGNVRQLRNLIEKMAVLSAGGKLTLADLPTEIAARKTAPTEDGDLNLAEAEKQRIIAALESCDGNRTEAAKLLGISRRTLHRKLDKWQMK